MLCDGNPVRPKNQKLQVEQVTKGSYHANCNRKLKIECTERHLRKDISVRRPINAHTVR